MLSKCLNPTCSETFRYLHDGRVFHLDIPGGANSGVPRRREFFWLCSRCSAKFTVTLKSGVPALQPRFRELASREQLAQEHDIFSRHLDPGAFGP